MKFNVKARLGGAATNREVTGDACAKSGRQKLIREILTARSEIDRLKCEGAKA